MTSQADKNQLFFQKIFNLVPIGLLVIDQEKKILAWNHWLRQKTLLEENTVKGLMLHELFPGKSYDRFNWALEQTLNYSQPQVLSQALNQYLIPIKMKKTHYTNVDYMQQHVEIHPIKVDEKKYALIIITDVTNKFHEKISLVDLAKKYNAESIHDALTGIYNRRYLWEWLEHAIADAKKDNLKIACSLYDIDEFKQINDKLGHKEGDRYILKFVDTVKSHIRDTDVFIRYGGDEFITISLESKDNYNPTALPNRINKSFFEPLNNTNKQQISCSCGVTIWNKINNAVDPKKLLLQADTALYKAKAAGRNCVSLYTPE